MPPFELPEHLLDAVLDARRITKFEARRRQLQFIGKLMRNVDAEPIRAQLAAWKAVSRAHTARLHSIERWRARLLEDDDALAELLRAHPQADARPAADPRAQREARAGRGQPPKSFRALFQLLNQTIVEERDDETAAQDADRPATRQSS